MGKGKPFHKSKKNNKSQKGIKINNKIQKKKGKPQIALQKLTIEEINEKYPILKNQDLIQKFMNVTVTNNQKGRIRQVLKDSLKGTSETLLPDVINNKIESIINNSEQLTETDLRKIRILYNMLKMSVQPATVNIETLTEEDAVNKSIDKKEIDKKDIGSTLLKNEKDKQSKELESLNTDKDGEVCKKEMQDVKPKGPKRYVVFVGNLPLGIEKEKLLKHFSDVSKCIKDVRIPKQSEDKRSCIAYVELNDEPSFELALSKHHSMFDNRRINVLYTTQSKSKISKSEAKGTRAKLVALQKTGKLLGSVPQNRKRSFRRKRQKEALAKAKAIDN